MIYTVFVKKYENDLSPFIHVQLLRQLILKTSNPFILGWPGYIGKCKKTIDDFYKEINPFYPKTLDGFFFKPMIVSSIPGIGTNESYMNSVFGGHTLPQPGLDDHSKILALLSIDFSNHKKVEDAIANDEYKVEAILIGSSNQSANTYCVTPTPKGEADVLMVEIDDRLVNNDNHTNDLMFLREKLGRESLALMSESDNTIVSKEILNKNSNLKAIIKKLLK